MAVILSLYNRDSRSCNIGTACGFTEFHPMNQIYSLWRQDPAVRVYIAVLCFKHSAKYPQLIAICVHIFNVYEKIFTAILNTEWITTLDYLTLCKSSLVTQQQLLHYCIFPLVVKSMKNIIFAQLISQNPTNGEFLCCDFFSCSSHEQPQPSSQSAVKSTVPNNQILCTCLANYYTHSFFNSQSTTVSFPDKLHKDCFRRYMLEALKQDGCHPASRIRV